MNADPQFGGTKLTNNWFSPDSQQMLVTLENGRFVQTNLPARAGAKPALPPRPVALPARVAANLESLPTGDLREALERLARGVYRKQG